MAGLDNEVKVNSAGDRQFVVGDDWERFEALMRYCFPYPEPREAAYKRVLRFAIEHGALADKTITVDPQEETGRLSDDNIGIFLTDQPGPEEGKQHE